MTVSHQSHFSWALASGDDRSGGDDDDDDDVNVQMIEEENLTYAEALWDHVTMDPDELGFRAGDLIRVTDTTEKHWWYGATEHRDGWFPAAFVRVSLDTLLCGVCAFGRGWGRRTTNTGGTGPRSIGMADYTPPASG